MKRRALIAIAIVAALTIPWVGAENYTGVAQRLTAIGQVGVAPPSDAMLTGVRASGTLAGLIACDSSAQAAVASATTTELVALTSGQTIYICGFTIEIQGIATTAGTAQLVYGTGSACATGTANISPNFIGSTTAGNPTVVAYGSGVGVVAKGAASNALCVTTTTTTVQKIFVSYTKF